MDGEQNIRRSTGDGEAGVADGQPGAQGVDGNGADGGNGAGSVGGGDAGGSVPAGGDASGGDQPAAATTPRASYSGDEAIDLDWKNNESDAEAAITWARYNAGQWPNKALRVLTTLAEDQELGIRNGDTPVRNNAKTALRDVLAQLG